jgi:hypothetical protein
MDKSNIKNKLLKENGKIYSILYLKNRFPDILKFIEENYDGLSLMEKIYKVVNDIDETPKCIFCNSNNVRFKDNYKKGYSRYCSLKCRSNHPDTISGKKNTMIEKYGVKHNFENGKLRDKIYDTCKLKYGTKTPIQNKEIRKKYEETMVGKYGVPCNFSLAETQEKVNETNIKKYGVKRPIQNEDIKEKIKKTNLEKYGSEWVINSEHYLSLINERFSTQYKKIDNIFQSEIIKESIKKNMIEKYGVENIMQNEKYYYQINIKSYSIKKYKDTDLYYQGTYELYFLENIEKKGLLSLVSNGLRFEYLLEDNSHYYFSDFYIKKLNKIIEIKSPWTYDRNGKDQKLKEINEMKKNCVTEFGLDFEFLIGKQNIMCFLNSL